MILALIWYQNKEEKKTYIVFEFSRLLGNNSLSSLKEIKIYSWKIGVRMKTGLFAINKEHFKQTNTFMLNLTVY